MAHSEFDDDDMERLLRICGIYDLGVLAFGLVAILAGHLAGGAGAAAVGLAALSYTLVAGRRHAADRASRAQERSCTQR